MVLIMMLMSVMIWFLLKAALFNVLKGNRLCNAKCCTGRTKDKIDKKTGKIIKQGGKKRALGRSFSKKFLAGLCPYALNLLSARGTTTDRLLFAGLEPSLCHSVN